MRFTILTFYCFLFHFSFAQKETSNWFLNGSQVKVTPGGITNEASFSTYSGYQQGSSSISDSSGKLTFYIHGNSIYNSNHETMPALKDILIRNEAATYIAPVPNSTKYYVFYTAATGGSINGVWTLQYALVDMSLQGGLGDVVEYDKVVDNSVSRGFSLAQATSDETWLVTHINTTDTFKTYLITAAGLSKTPSVSKAGSLASTENYIYKDLKTSNNGKLIAGLAYRDYTEIFASTYGVIEVFNFDPKTGKLAEKVRTVRKYDYFSSNWSLAFSPNDQLLYAAMISRVYGLQPCGFGSGAITQYNLCYTDSTEFNENAMIVASDYNFCFPDVTWGTMQLGADKVIYIPYSGTMVSAIRYPNRLGTSCGYERDAHQVLNHNGQWPIAPSFYHKELAKAVINNIVYSGGCYPDPVTLQITNDTIGRVEWNFGDLASGATNTSALLKPQHIFSKPGIYTITAKLYNNTGQFIEEVVELIEVKNPTNRLLHEFPTDTVLCPGQQLKIGLNVVNGIFTWKRRDLNNDTFYDRYIGDSLNTGTSGVYYVEMRLRDCNTCVMTDSIKVVAVGALELGSDRKVCIGDSTMLFAGYTSANLLWNTGSKETEIWVKKGGLYWVETSFKNKCITRDSVMVTEFPNVHFSLPNDTTLCNNQTLTLSPGVANANYYWQDGSQSPTFKVTQPQIYWVSVSSPDGCSKLDSIVVNYINVQSVSLGNDTALCAGGQLPLNLNLANSTYEWSNGSKSNSIIVKQSGAYWVKVNNGQCTISDTINVFFQPKPQLQLGNDTSICEKQTLLLKPTISGNYVWSDGSTSNSLTVRQPGLYWASVSQTGCVARDSINVSFLPAPQINIGSDTSICTGTSLKLTVNQPNIRSYLWQDGTKLPTYNITVAGSYWVRIQHVNGCSSADTIVVQNTPLPAFDLGSDASLCQGQRLDYSFSLSGASYLWNTGTIANSISINKNGLYWLEVIQNGCLKRDSVNAVFKPLPTVLLGNDTTLCEGSVLPLNAFIDNAQYQWKDGASTPTFTVLQPGLYWVKTVLEGCSSTDSIQVNYNYRPAFTLGNDTTLCTGQTLLLTPKTGLGNYVWQDGSTAPSFLATIPGEYRLTVSNQCGSNTDFMLIEKGLCQLYMPDAFTPNNDGNNDIFRVKYPAFINTFYMQVSNRWGQKIFSTTNPFVGWDGKYKGQEQPSGNFMWSITLIDKEGKPGQYSGSVMLLR